VRTAMQALAAVLGGTQSLHTNAYDEALALPTEKSAEIALRTQQVIAYESGAAESADPLAGSYYVEYLTNEMEKRIYEVLEEIERQGGAVKGVESGYFKNEIAKAAYKFQKEIESEQRVVVGVNKFVTETKTAGDILKLNPELEEKQKEKLRELRKRRDNAAVETALANLEKAASGKENIVPPVIEAVEKYATVGEISDRLRKIWGEYHERI